MKFSFGRLGAVLRKELREYRRSPFIIVTMAVLPFVFLIEPLITIFSIGPLVAASTVDKAVSATFLVLLIAPALLPAVIASYSVVGEREQGTLEPLLTTPLRREELLLDAKELDLVYRLRRVLSDMSPVESVERLKGQLSKVPSNAQFLLTMNLD